MKKLPSHKIENHSGFHIPIGNKIKTIKQHQYFIVKDKSISGDAPKAFMYIYEYARNSKVRKSNSNSWASYIVKTGHKWYPIESITEYLLNQLGIDFGLNMADSKIILISGQLRFCSRYFLKDKKSELVHGADIFAGYLGDKAFVESIEEEQLSRDLFTLQFIEKSIEYIFYYQKDIIMFELVRMLLFDALVGNNDRHFYNWGVIRTLNNSKNPIFSPIYDTARGLFWNESESKIKNIWFDKNRLLAHIKKYSDSSKPKIGWEGEKNINHFNLVEKICKEMFYISRQQLNELFSDTVLQKMLYTINVRFKNYYSKERIEMITKCIEYRYNYIEKIISQC
ncbi:hypothetical protein EZS27_020915 [termite gut metagenome]|uniref:HipA-like C-terminal domain-containing protein n=1 Tax=termite gut metagenome TaxID=433724 RepID=A0A5J4RBS4_9ZZZZ